MKPHFKRVPSGWQCQADGLVGVSKTPEGAYTQWYRRRRLVDLYGLNQAKQQWESRESWYTSSQPWDVSREVLQ